MAQHSHGAIAQPGKYGASNRTKTAYSVAVFAGLLLFVLSIMKDPARAWHSYLASYFFFTCLAIGAMFFTAIQFTVKAGWSVTIRRFMEALTSYLPIAAASTVVLLFGLKYLYLWVDKDVVAHDAILLGKSSYLNVGFFLVRLVVFFGVWILLRNMIVGNSLKQDKDGDEMHTVKNTKYSVIFLLIFAISFSLFSVDTLMSLQPHWYSTMWGVYCFSGMFQSTLACLTIITCMMIKKGLVRGLVNENHLHDLGKFLKGFTVFMAYIGFSQFLLIWYANLPEETIFYLARSTGGWMTASLSLLVFKFIVPFLLLLPKAAKRNPNHLIMVSTIVLIMQYVDIHWMIYPNLDSANYLMGWQEAGPFLMLGGLFLYSVTNFLSKNSLVPMRDPRLEESVYHVVTY